MKLGVKEMKREYKKVNIDNIEVSHLREEGEESNGGVVTGHAG